MIQAVEKMVIKIGEQDKTNSNIKIVVGLIIA